MMEDFVRSLIDELNEPMRRLGMPLSVLMDQYECLENENKKLEEELKWCKDYIAKLDELDTRDFIFRHELEENYVPKERIVGKIEQFKHISAAIQGYKYSDVPTDLKRNDYAVNMLLELLGEEK